MASSSAVAVWRPVVQVPSVMPVASMPAVRLTRRGRAFRAGALVVVLVALAVLGIDRLSARPALAGTAVPAAPATTTVVVEEGDSLWGIARRVAPSTDPRDVVESIRTLNGMRSNLIHPGQALLVPATPS
ncbi:MAG: LysM peptidoglycan-binding domain-containing protein [Candidatus Nanopelagicales bacterium]|jgi:nucleoid-associated protein YgaU|nr:LysM peptidoglycan-binding domain-containing protein [Candidatus Nanopelagicales bacterium]